MVVGRTEGRCRLSFPPELPAERLSSWRDDAVMVGLRAFSRPGGPSPVKAGEARDSAGRREIERSVAIGRSICLVSAGERERRAPWIQKMFLSSPFFFVQMTRGCLPSGNR